MGSGALEADDQWHHLTVGLDTSTECQINTRHLDLDLWHSKTQPNPFIDGNSVQAFI